MIAYSAAISACEKALELLEEMRRKGLEPNVVTCYAANRACDNAIQSQRVLELIQEMQLRGLGARCDHIQRSHQCM